MTVKDLFKQNHPKFSWSELVRFEGMSVKDQTRLIAGMIQPPKRGRPKKHTSSEGGLFTEEDLLKVDSVAAWLRAAEDMRHEHAVGVLTRPEVIRAVQSWIWEAFSPSFREDDEGEEAQKASDRRLSFDTRVFKAGLAWIEQKGRFETRKGVKTAAEFKKLPANGQQMAHREEILGWAHWLMHVTDGPFGSTQVCLSQGICPDSLRDAMDQAYPWFVEIADQYEAYLRKLEQ